MLVESSWEAMAVESEAHQEGIRYYMANQGSWEEMPSTVEFLGIELEGAAMMQVACHPRTSHFIKRVMACIFCSLDVV